MILTNGTTRLQPGDRVMFDRKYPAIVRYFGKVGSSPKVWVGVELQDQVGKNDGCAGGKRYFKCKPGYGIFALPSRFTKRPELEIGCKVVVKKQYVGTVRFIGETEYSTGEWVGVELKDPVGKHDGMFRGKRYFTCAKGHGIFARPTQVVRALSDTHSTDGRRTQRRSRSSPDAAAQSQDLKDALAELDKLREENSGLKRQVEDLRKLVVTAEQLSLSEHVQDILPGNMADPTEEEIERRSSFSSGDERRLASRRRTSLRMRALASASSSSLSKAVGAAAGETHAADTSTTAASTQAAMVGTQEEAAAERDSDERGESGDFGASAGDEDTAVAGDEQEAVTTEGEEQQGDKNVFLGESQDGASSPKHHDDEEEEEEEEEDGDGDDDVTELREVLESREQELKYMKRQVAFEQAKVSELAKLLDMAKRSLVEGARRETGLKDRLKAAEQRLENAEFSIDDYAIHGDAVEAELQEALRDKQELSDRLAECQMELLDAKTDQFTAMTECEMMRQDLLQLRQQLSGDTVVAVEVDGAEDKNTPQTDAADAEDADQQTQEQDSEQATLADDVGAGEHAGQSEARVDTSEDGAESDGDASHRRQLQLEVAATEPEPTSAEEEEEAEAAFLERPPPPPGVDASLFCTICEEYGHTEDDCDDTITF
ncbi:hypothetical protein PTSG_08852 [Salpingoeca rosetta]|uniref:CAP-Gly domain-containing protein n=1 Tax=Salpingoeca rosetta (strain ATCC 50818 / BSB-021) TaxID=946362 RepID=F2UKW4_SALR5|nr:uncharacterized protein PTSG_08852 [Salpingoeca rosetta]EGD77763.1 hypothetical protein PTSG_08852 [Salpingoeca rosetta]|eukprot:XP_004990239.1 hypothetical protein PTSG_08852 [Salpingoeca rosetta]